MGSGVFSFLSVFHAQCVNRAGVCECIVALCTYSGFNREEIFRPGVFLFMLGSKRTVCGRRRLGRYPILRLTSSLRCARGGAAAGWIEKVSECRETAGVQRRALQSL